MTTREQAVKMIAARAISRTRRRPSASRATGTWTSTTVTALAASSSPIGPVGRPITACANGGSSQVNVPQPTAITARFAAASRRNAPSRRTCR
jgi:hypothetical protein